MRHNHEEDEVQEILKRAMEIDSQQRTRQDALRMSAAELGISDEALAKAEVQYLREKAEKDELEEFKAHQRRGYWEHVASYVIVNSFLVAINLYNWNGHFWAIYPILGWGIGALLHTVSALSTKSEDFQREFERWKRRRDRRRAAVEEHDDNEEDEDDDDHRSHRSFGVHVKVDTKRDELEERH